MPHRIALMLLCAAALSAPVRAVAAERAPQFARYLPLYPGLYGELAYGQNDRDRAYSQSGDEDDTAAPQTPGRTELPEKYLLADLNWYFPMFEGQAVPFFSSRLHMARVRLSYHQLSTRGALRAFIDDGSDDADTEADNLRGDGSGVGDPSFEFGSFILGSPDWRKGERKPYALLGLLGVRFPGGKYERDAPVSSGSNTTSLYATLGGHWQPWHGGFVDGGFSYYTYLQNYDAAFGGYDPANQGDDRVIDLSVAQRLPHGFYLSAFATDRRGGRNSYANPRFAPNRPAPPTTVPESNNFPTPGTYFDDGTALREAGVSLHWFALQRVQLGVHYTAPQSGKSGQFLLPYTNRQPANCTLGGTGCQTTAGESVLVDGTGAARSFASQRWMLTARYQFGLGDPYTCTGCAKP